jgi:hypothetical protein
MTGRAVVNGRALAAGLLLAPVAVAAEGVEQPVDAHRLADRQPLMTRDAILLAGAVGEIVMAGRAQEIAVVMNARW